jgi:aminoglycoside phosphotransferase (APT) family kinase protein
MLSQEQQERLCAHLAGVLGAKSVTIGHVRRFHGGASRETFGLDTEVDGVARGLILRRDPADSLIDTDRNIEYAAFQSFEGGNIPVPRAVTLVNDDSVIGAPFFVMERIDGGEAGSPFDPNCYGEHAAAIGRQFFTHLGSIHARDALSSPLAEVAEVPTNCWQRELDYWENEILKDSLEPQPIAAGVIRWLRANPPAPPAQLHIVHGDYRTGNVLHDGHGQIIAVLDWEMAHLGDPHEDLAWTLDPIWNFRRDDSAGGLIPRDEAIALWEGASGLTFDPERFRWWEMFATIKGLGIWVSAAKAFADGLNPDPILQFSGLIPTLHANQTMAARMAAYKDAA